jgi:hypothetical protein
MAHSPRFSAAAFWPDCPGVVSYSAPDDAVAVFCTSWALAKACPQARVIKSKAVTQTCLIFIIFKAPDNVRRLVPKPATWAVAVRVKRPVAGMYVPTRIHIGVVLRMRRITAHMLGTFHARKWRQCGRLLNSLKKKILNSAREEAFSCEEA